MEVGAPRRREALPCVGVDAGARAEAPLEGSGFPTDEEARAQGYRDAKDPVVLRFLFLDNERQRNILDNISYLLFF